MSRDKRLSAAPKGPSRRRIFLAVCALALCAHCRHQGSDPQVGSPAVQNGSPSGVGDKLESSEPAKSVRWIEADSPLLRELTVAIIVKPPDILAESYLALAKRHQQLGPLLLTHAEGGFGSGFVMMRSAAPKGIPQGVFFVTNQHVVGLAEDALIRFDGAKEEYPARVIYVDETYDLAVLALKEHPSARLPIAAGFGFESALARDQDPIITSGYPAIGGEPSYQVTRGYVSNERLILPLGNDELVLIQHTAPIDPGSSGGPLLSTNNRVLGINTLKIRDREAVGVAVPSTAIQHALAEVERLAQSDSAESATELAAREVCQRLLRSFRQEEAEPRVERSLSARLVAKWGPTSLGLLPDDGTDWGRLFVESPEEVLLYAVYLRLRADFEKFAEDVRCEQILPGSKEAPPGGIGFVVRTKDRTRHLRFAPEQGRLKLAEVDLPGVSSDSFLTPKSGRQKKWSPTLK